MEKAGSLSGKVSNSVRLSYHEGYGIQCVYKRRVFEYKEGLEDGS